ncbi:MAG TPA: GNAT family N-acetyltransferase [Pirellulales bacterium]|nr:GNAT family N-acetyltransferase [Pirellulales bacterium]
MISRLPVVHFSRELLCQPVVEDLAGVRIRNYAGEQDVDAWLDLHKRAFASQFPAVRTWTRGDFEAEFARKPWWSPDRMWFAEAEGIVGSVTLALRGRRPVVHWLMVAPEWRRHGVGRFLMANLEAACWRAGHRELSLETHVGWTAAEAFYRAVGYEP